MSQTDTAGGAARTTAYSYTAGGDQLQSATVGSLTQNYFYDGDGNMTCVTQSSTRTAADCVAPDDGSQNASPNLLQTYAYDYRDRLQGFRAFSNGTKSSWADYLSDPLDRPAQQTDQSGSPNAKTTLFSYLGLTNQMSLEEVQGQTGPTPIRSYSYDAAGNRVSMVDKPGQAETTYMFGYDVQGSVSQLVDRSGQVKAAYGYTPYGSNDNSLTPQSSVDNPTATRRSASTRRAGRSTWAPAVSGRTSAISSNRTSTRTRSATSGSRTTRSRRTGTTSQAATPSASSSSTATW